MSQVVGTVEKAFDKAIVVSGVRYGAYKPEQLAGAKQGDEVQFDFKENGQYKNISGNVRVVNKSAAPKAAPSSGNTSSRSSRANGEEGGFPLHEKSYERALDRRNAINAAVAYAALAKLKPESPGEIVDIAREFEAYTTGDTDKEMEALAAAAMLGN